MHMCNYVCTELLIGIFYIGANQIHTILHMISIIDVFSYNLGWNSANGDAVVNISYIYVRWFQFYNVGHGKINRANFPENLC